MDSRTLVERVMKNLSFQVEAIPINKTVQDRFTSSKVDPMNVTVKVRKKDINEQYNRGFISNNQSEPEKLLQNIRFVSSHDTIMSFDMFMEEEGKNNIHIEDKRKPQQHILDKLKTGICLGATSDDDNHPYMPNKYDVATFQDTWVLGSKSKDKLREYGTSRKKTERTFLGQKCKPGGCLDPPFGEDTYSYNPVVQDSIVHLSNNSSTENLEHKVKDVNSNIKTTGKNERRKKSKDPLFCINPANEEQKSDSVLNIYKIDSKRNSVRTYLPDDNNKAIKSNIASEDKPRQSINDPINTFFSPPKGIKRESNNNVQQDTSKRHSNTLHSIKDKSSKNFPLPVPIAAFLNSVAAEADPTSKNIDDITTIGDIKNEQIEAVPNSKQEPKESLAIPIEVDKESTVDNTSYIVSSSPIGDTVKVSTTSITNSLNYPNINKEVSSRDFNDRNPKQNQEDQVTANLSNLSVVNKNSSAKEVSKTSIESIVDQANRGSEMVSMEKNSEMERKSNANQSNIFDKPNEVQKIIEKPNEVQNIIKKIVEVNNIIQKPHEIQHVIEKPDEVENIIEKPLKVQNIIEKPESVQNIIEKPVKVQNTKENADTMQIIEEPDEIQNILENTDVLNISEKSDEVQNTIAKFDEEQNTIEKPDVVQNIIEKPDIVQNIIEKPDKEQNIIKQPGEVQNITEKPDEIQNIVKEPDEVHNKNRDNQLSKISEKPPLISDHVIKHADLNNKESIITSSKEITSISDHKLQLENIYPGTFNPSEEVNTSNMNRNMMDRNDNENISNVTDIGDQQTNNPKQIKEIDLELPKKQSVVSLDGTNHNLSQSRSNSGTNKRIDINLDFQGKDSTSKDNGSSIDRTIPQVHTSEMETETTLPKNSEVKGETSSPRPDDLVTSDLRTVSLNFAFHSYLNNKNERIFKTINDENEVNRYPNDSVTVINSQIKSSLQENYPELIIPIDSSLNMMIKIKNNNSESYTESDKSKTMPVSNYGPNAQTSNSTVKTKSLEQKVHYQVSQNNIVLDTTLTDIYERELIPLQKMIRALKADVDILAKQHILNKTNVICLKKLPRP